MTLDQFAYLVGFSLPTWLPTIGFAYFTGRKDYRREYWQYFVVVEVLIVLSAAGVISLFLLK